MQAGRVHVTKMSSRGKSSRLRTFEFFDSPSLSCIDDWYFNIQRQPGIERATLVFHSPTGLHLGLGSSYSVCYIGKNPQVQLVLICDLPYILAIAIGYTFVAWGLTV